MCDRALWDPPKASADLSSCGLGAHFSQALLKATSASSHGASPGSGGLDVSQGGRIGPAWLDLSGNALLTTSGHTAMATVAAVARGAISGCKGVSLAWNGALGPESALMVTAMAQVRCGHGL